MGRARALRAEGKAFLLATLVAVRGSSYRRPGARFVVSDDGEAAGSVSGGCLERDLARRGWWRTQGGRPALVTYDSTSDDGDFGARVGLGCNGVVDILLERVEPPVDRTPLPFLDACLARETGGVLVTVFRSQTPSLPPGAWLGLASDGEAMGSARADVVHEVARAVSAADGPRVVTIALAEGDAEALVEVIGPRLISSSWAAGRTRRRC